jgi:SAM-dependent methyltransferase
MTTANQTDLEFISAHARLWDSKPHLRDSYARYHSMLVQACLPESRVLELGCGLGKLAALARAEGRVHWIPTDIIAAPGARLRCDGTALPVADGALDQIVFLDVLHHLASPLRFFQEAARALRPGGSVVCVEPWITPLSYPIYRFVHHEGCDLSRDVEAPFAKAGSKPAYEGDNSIPTLLVRKVGPERWAELGFAAPAVEPFNDFAYLTTRGFREGADSPSLLYHASRLVLDRWLAPLAGVLGFRARIRWTRLS